MALVSEVKRKITGLSIQQEYLCISLRDLSYPMRVFATVKKNTIFLEVTSTHLFLGYKPLVMALTFAHGSDKLRGFEAEKEVSLHFGQMNFEMNTAWQGHPADKRSIARLALRQTIKRVTGSVTIIFYEGILGEHVFISQAHQGLNNLLEKLRKRAQSNVSLPGNLYGQVRIAYSVPRIISVITVSDGKLVNMFPTDLHGSPDNVIYASSLRIGGEANQQVELYQRVVISEVDPSWYREAYALGKNHRKKLKRMDSFRTHPQLSDQFHFPLPEGVVRYREMVRKDSIDMGIHRIHLYEINSFHTVVEERSTLAHVHQYYAQWRIDQGLKTDYLLR
jgi:hypothetical protein